MTFAGAKFRTFFERFRPAVEGVELGADPLKVSFTLRDLPTARREFRELLQGQLQTIYDLVNTEILAEASSWLANRGYERMLIIVDQLDRIPQKLLNGHRLTNHESLFLDHAGTLRALSCPVLYTVPIELAYSRCHGRLQDVYGSKILTLPAIPVRDRDGEESVSGLGVLRKVVEQRATKAGLTLDEVFEQPELLTTVLRRSGGHIRGLFVLLSSVLDQTADLPITPRLLEQSLRDSAADFALPLRASDWRMLEDVRKTHQPTDEESDVWNGLLRDRFVLAYRDERGYWYDSHPLLELVQREGHV